MRILVFGGQEFLGKVIVEALLASGFAVDVLSRGSRSAITGVKQLIANRYDPKQIDAAIVTTYDCIVDVSGTHPRMLQVSCQNRNIRSCPKYIYVSSASVYNRLLSQLPFHEDGAGGGDAVWGEYGQAKWACEEILRGSFHGTLLILRPPYVYGPHNTDLREQFVWARVLHQLPVPVPGDGQRKLQFCYVADLARLVAVLVEDSCTPSRTLNVAGREVVTQRQWVSIAARAAGVEPELTEFFRAGMKARDYFPFRDVDFYLDTGMLQATQSFAGTSLLNGLTSTLEWFRKSRPGDLIPTLSAFERGT